jgi:hypothetical protein
VRPRAGHIFLGLLVGAAAISAVGASRGSDPTFVSSPQGSQPDRAQPSELVSVQVAPRRVVAGGWKALTFTFEASARALRRATVRLSIPSGWAPPSKMSSAAGYVTASAGALSVKGSSIAVRRVILSPSSQLTITYGGGSGGATAPSEVGRYAFPVSVAPSASRASVPLGRPPSVRVKAPAFDCRATLNPTGSGQQLALPNGIAQANLHNTQTSTGRIQQCYAASGLTTTTALTSISPIGHGPAGYPEAAYGYNLYAVPFCDACHSEPFPIRISDLRTQNRDLRLTADYTLGPASPSSLPRDFMYDLWLEREPSPGTPPRPGDVEVIVFLYQQRIATCIPSRDPASFSTRILINGRRVTSRWSVCEIYGGTAATPVAFFLESPKQFQTAEISLGLSSFLQKAGTFLGRDVGAYSLMGVELGGEFDQCSPPSGCTASTSTWRWRISELTLERGDGTIPIVFGVRR